MEPLKSVKLYLLLILIMPGVVAGAKAADTTDIAGSSDHPMLSRFPGTNIVAYENRYHDVAWLPGAPSGNKGFTEGEWIKGRLTWLIYQSPADRSTLEIYRNYEKALKDAGFEIGFSCKKDGCGKRFIKAMLQISGRMMDGGERWMPDSARYLSARLSRDEGGSTWVSLLIHERNTEGLSAIRLIVVEENEPRELDKLKATAAGSKSVNYDEARMATGMAAGNKLQDVVELEGKIEWRAFRFDQSVSAYEAFASYLRDTETKGYRAQFRCHFKFCGSRFIRKVVDLNGNIIAGGERWSQDSAHYFMARLATPEKSGYGSVLAYKQPDGIAVLRMLSVIPEEIEFDLITVSGESMADEMDKSGKVAVYGIYFDTDSADVQSESSETLTEIAKLMALRPGLLLFVDGHTDDEGTQEYNQALSQDRAQSVVDALIKQQGIEAGRLQARGFGESRPVSANDSEDGRSWNRRVELVAR